MTIKLNDLTRWNELSSGSAIGFRDGPMRRVRLSLNCIEQTVFYIKPENGDLRFLTTVPAGLSVIEFRASGAFAVGPEEGGAVYWQCAEDEPTAVETDGESFTTIAMRPARNLELERVMFVQEQNARRREAALLAEVERLTSKGQANGETGIHGKEAAKHQKPAEQKASRESGSDGVLPGSGRSAGEADRRPADEGSQPDGKDGVEAKV